MVTRGFYRHYKGEVYFVESVGTLHDKTRRIVVYQSTQSVGEPNGVRLRYEDDFEEFVDPDTGKHPRLVKTGVTLVPRFRRLTV